MSKRRDIETLSSLLGNSATHAALLPDSEYAQKEVTTYMTDFYEIASSRAFSKTEVEQVRQKAAKRARAEVVKRIKRYGFDIRKHDEFVKASEKYIDSFLEEVF